LATVRNPLDRYVSQFSFGWWKKDPELFGGLDEVRMAYPTYPDLSFSEFVAFANDRLLPVTEPTGDGLVLGLQSQQFILQYALDPKTVILRTGPKGRGEPIGDSFCPHRYLHQERLQEDLATFMDQTAYETDEINFARTSKRVYPPEGGRPASDDWRRYYTPELESWVRSLEGWLLRRFPDYAE
jgi:hypothetical protein